MSNTSLQDLLKQQAALAKQIAQVQQAERNEAIAKVRELMNQYGLSVTDLGGRSGGAASPRTRSTGKVAPKYRNKATGETWTGRGLKPKWLSNALASGAKLDDFKI